jgi:hypothetical protein
MNSKPRAATILCMEETYCAIIEKVDYKKSIDAVIQKKMQD